MKWIDDEVRKCVGEWNNMSYTEREKQEVICTPDKVINRSSHPKKRIPFYVWGLIILGVLIIGVSVLMTTTEARTMRPSDWSLRIDCYAGGGHTYCIMGENSNASDGIDVFDVPHHPFEPAGRAFIFFHHPEYPNPYNYIWMEYQYHEHVLTDKCTPWYLTTFFLPMTGGGSVVQLQWNSSNLFRSGYNHVVLYYNGYLVDMKTTGSYSFYSPPYVLCRLLVICD